MAKSRGTKKATPPLSPVEREVRKVEGRRAAIVRELLAAKERFNAETSKLNERLSNVDAVLKKLRG